MLHSIENIIDNYKDVSIKERDLKQIELCRRLKPVMNEVHNLNYSERFWIIILSYYVKSCLSRKSYFCKENMRTSPLFLPINGWVPPSKKQIIQSNILYFLRALKYRKSLRTICNKIKNNHNICIGNRGPLMEKYNIGAYCPSYFIIPKPSKKVKSKRKKLINIANKQDDVFFKNIIKNIPEYYIEYYDYVVSKIHLFEPECKIFHGIHFPIFMGVMLAYYLENGAKYYEYQDGGFRGETCTSIRPDRYFKYDKHRTYGWTLTDKDEPFYAFRLHEFKLKYESTSEKKENDILIVYNIISSKNKERYYDVSQKIFKQIDRNKYPQIQLRPRGRTKFLSNKKDMAYLEPPSYIKIDKGKSPLAHLVRHSKVVIHLNHPSTNFLECVYVDHPVVAILTNNNPTQIVEPYYDFFLENGVMHHNIESLIDHLNKVNLYEWWENVIKKSQYQQFKNNFARKVPELGL